MYITLPIDPESDNQAEQQRMLQRIKSAFLDGDTSAVVVSLIAEPLARFEEVRRPHIAGLRVCIRSSHSSSKCLPGLVACGPESPPTGMCARSAAENNLRGGLICAITAIC